LKIKISSAAGVVSFTGYSNLINIEKQKFTQIRSNAKLWIWQTVEEDPTVPGNQIITEIGSTDVIDIYKGAYTKTLRLSLIS
jgi:hypothetical protein